MAIDLEDDKTIDLEKYLEGKNMKVILISGKQGAGKTTLQKALTENLFKLHKKRAVVMNFADFIYEIHDFTINRLASYGVPTEQPKDGYLLQVLGTEWGRKTRGENIWVDVLKGKIQKMLDLKHEIDYVIIGDCRFKNEFDAFPEALRVRLECDEEVRKERVSMWRDTTNHPSEIDLDDYALAKKFDLHLDTALTPVNGLVDLIGAQLQKDVWMEKR